MTTNQLRRMLHEAENMIADLRFIIEETYASRNEALVAGVHGNAEADEDAAYLSTLLAHVTMAHQSMGHVAECLTAAAYPDD
jgi:hypothetical protein